MSKNERLDKCDFCACRNQNGYCTGQVGSEACTAACLRFMDYMKAVASNSHTNNVNINRNNHNTNKNYKYNNKHN